MRFMRLEVWHLVVGVTFLCLGLALLSRSEVGSRRIALSRDQCFERLRHVGDAVRLCEEKLSVSPTLSTLVVHGYLTSADSTCVLTNKAYCLTGCTSNADEFVPLAYDSGSHDGVILVVFSNRTCLVWDKGEKEFQDWLQAFGRRRQVEAELIGQPRYKSQQPVDGLSAHVEAKTTIDTGSFDQSANSEAFVTVRVRNCSDHDVVIAKVPTEYDQVWPRGLHSQGLGSLKARAKEVFVNLRPAESVSFELSVDDDFLLADPDSRTLSLTYRNSGTVAGTVAWIGVLKAKFGAEWKEERKLEDVIERWPNGNLKAVGQTLNDKEYGEWNYFNEEGDRIGEFDYSGASAEIICDPEHPSNKRAGRMNP